MGALVMLLGILLLGAQAYMSAHATTAVEPRDPVAAGNPPPSATPRESSLHYAPGAIGILVLAAGAWLFLASPRNSENIRAAAKTQQGFPK